MNKIIVLTLLLLINGCAGFGQSVVTPPKEVAIPIITPCVTEVPTKPASEFELAKDKSVFEQVKALLIDLENDLIYESSLESTIAGCR